jgi:alkylation response protein AidB-like acyl-CoA dehydrogenase
MDLNYTREEQAFRDEVRGFVRDNLPKDIAEKCLHHKRLVKDDWVRWQKILYKKGWVAPNWPKQYGGCAWTPIQQHIFDEECGYAGAPRIIPFGLVMVAPVIQNFGSQWQKDYYLPRILSSEDWWAQGYSEPGSGSDLASLKMKAVREGDEYLVNGQKTWTTLGQYADMIFCLVRTDSTVKKQEGISFLLIDMHSPGITVRPIITLDEEHEINEVFFDNVRVPAKNLVGEEGKGWTYAKFLLGHERTGIARVGESKRELAQLKEIAAKQLRGGKPLLEDARFRDRIVQVEVELMALEMTLLRVLSSRSKPGPEASLLKIKGVDVQQALTELTMEAMGPYALPFRPETRAPDWHGESVGPEYAASAAAVYFNYRKTSIYGGSNEVQRNIISQMVLGL